MWLEEKLMAKIHYNNLSELGGGSEIQTQKK